MEWDDDAAFMALSKRVTGKDRIDKMTSGERASLIAEIRKEAPPVTPVPTKVVKSLPMNFVYGKGTALSARDDVKSKTTFDAILAGERTATSRKDKSLDKINVGDVVEFYAIGRKERIKARVTSKRKALMISPDVWSKLEGYDEAAVKNNWKSGKNLSKYVQIEFEVIDPAIPPVSTAVAPSVVKGKTVVESYDSVTGKTTVETQDKKIIKLYRAAPKDFPIFEHSKERGVYGFIEREDAIGFGEVTFEFEYSPDVVLVTNSQISGIMYLFDKMGIDFYDVLDPAFQEIQPKAKDVFPTLTDKEIASARRAFGPREIYGDYPDVDFALDKMFAVLAKKAGYDAAKLTEVPTAKQWEIAMKGYEPESPQYVIFGDVGKIIKSPEAPVSPAVVPAVTDKEIIADEVTKSGIEIYKKFVTPAEEMYQSFKYIILTTGRKSFGWTSAWYGPIDYTYTGITHKRQKMPKEFYDLARQIEEATGVESGYYNSALVNLFPKGVGKR